MLLSLNTNLLVGFTVDINTGNHNSCRRHDIVEQAALIVLTRGSPDVVDFEVVPAS